MKLSETAPIILNIIKTSRKINAINIAKISGLTIRRIYDVTTVLEALDLVDIENPKKGRGKIYVWRGTEDNKDTKGFVKKVKFNSRQIKISCINGTIVKIKNDPIAVIIEGSHNLTVEKYEEFLSK